MWNREHRQLHEPRTGRLAVGPEVADTKSASATRVARPAGHSHRREVSL